MDLHNSAINQVRALINQHQIGIESEKDNWPIFTFVLGSHQIVVHRISTNSVLIQGSPVLPSGDINLTKVDGISDALSPLKSYLQDI